MNIFLFIENILYIIEGYIKWFFDIITFRKSKRAAYRLNICNLCEHNIRGTCKLCGCILKAKVRVDFILDNEGLTIDGCPERKW